MNHVILGAGGSIGNALTYELLSTNENVRLVSRRNYSIEGAESFQGDISSYNDTLNSVKNADVVYLCAGLAYDSDVWSVLWPKIMQNAIDACKKVNAKLIFFDNVYMYGKVDGKMTEKSPYDPCSRKGEIRANIAIMLQDEMRNNNLQGIIARSADLYGPYITRSSVPYIMAFDNMLKGKKAQWLVDADKLHSFTYTIDSAKAMKLLSQKEECFQQVWHMPTFNPGITGKMFIEMIAKELEVSPDFSILKKWMIRMAGFFNKTIFESFEMLYQSENEYYFDSTKFNEYFDFKPTSYEDGIRESIKFYKK